MAGRLALIRINSVAQSDNHLIWRLLKRLSLHAMLARFVGKNTDDSGLSSCDALCSSGALLLFDLTQDRPS
jgi:hypothetical protein